MTTESSTTLDDALELHRSGNLPAAAEAYERLLQNEPRNHDAQYGLGTVRMQQGELEPARTLLEQAVGLAPNVPEYRYNLGCVLQLTGAHFEAVEQLQAAAAARPDSAIILVALARSLGEIQNYPAAVQAMEQALAGDDVRAADVVTYANLLFKAHQPDAAREQVDRARQLGSKDPLGYFIEARCEHAAGHHDAERELLRKAIEMLPGYGDAWQHLLELTPDDELLALADDCEALSGDFATAPSDKAKLCYTVGRAYERLGDYDESVKHFETANRRQRQDASSRGKVYSREAIDRYLVWVRETFDGQGSLASAAQADAQPIFIVGMPRTGTTLVESILDGLEGVAAGGESEAMELVTLQYYRALAQGQSPQVRDLQAAHWDELAKAYWQCQVTPMGRVTDKMPTNFRHVGMICRMFPQAPVIYLRRDPRDVGWSIYSRYFPDGHPYATDFEDIAHYYSHSLQLMEHFKSLHPDRVHEIQYEGLIADPEETTRALAAFCGLQWRPECLDFHDRQRASYTFSDMQVREPLNNKGIGRWRNYESFMTPFLEACKAYGVPLQD
jgi:tetratricopeptide (TPR) repeat protein